MKTQIDTQGLFDYDGGFYGKIAMVFDCFMLNVLWIVFSLPIVTFGAASTAFYYTAVKVIKKDRGNILEQFLNAFKINFKDATILWLLIVVLSFIFQLNVGILSSLTEGNVSLFFRCFYIFLSVFIIGIAMYAFPALSRFDMSTSWILKLSIYMTVRYFPITLILFVILLLSALLLYLLPIFVIILPTGSIIVYSYFMEKVLLKHTPGV
ncbi:DUF624 domain-containing protein [Iocasia frigidifontis]|uniref:DUF624 domain-containing protein n=1 Tax=Iocasia fonsfrigidae TaxID=2682810 RepID=A0A8A7KBL6_9FIRM|nr:YesL family protein [Iocasia fonsfrigidae]QTL97485.1 DUF624 domain-containing protein [Iocasia fonsfrigidae]